MAAGYLDITVEQGATFHETILWKNPDGTPRNLTSVDNIRGQIRPTPESTTVSATFVLSVLGNPLDGKIDWYLGATASAAIPILCADQAYDIDVLWLDGTVTRLLQGAATISPGVTR